MESYIRRFDEAIMLAFRNSSDDSDLLGPSFIEEIIHNITVLGSTTALTLISLVFLGYLLLGNRHNDSVFLLISVSGGILINALLKIFFNRPRPDLVPHEVIVFTASFPSGHAMMSMITYVTIATILGRIHSQPGFNTFFYFIAILLTTLVGTSRIYLGVHWPTDVIAGWITGLLWVVVCWQSNNLIFARK